MNEEYDFSKAERGKFFRPEARLVPPVHIDPEVLDFLAQHAKARGLSLDEFLNRLLKRDMQQIEAGLIV